jgi:membrane fusion protein (multidrug efflux system)
VTQHRPWLALVAANAALAVAACSRPSPPAAAQAAAPPPLPADVQSVAAVTRAETAPSEVRAGQLEATGEFVSPVRSELVSKLPGRVATVLVDEGAPVRKGQILLELEAEYFKLDVSRAEADLSRAEAAAREARRDFERKRGLLAKGSVSQAVHDRSMAAAEQAGAAEEAARAALALARQRLADVKLASPIDGVVLERRADVGERLGDNTVAFVLVQTAPLKLRFRVPERYLGEVRPGLPVRAAVDPYAGQKFEGRVAVVGQAVDPATRTLMVEADFPNRDGRLRSGLFARVEMDLAPAKTIAP